MRRECIAASTYHGLRCTSHDQEIKRRINAKKKKKQRRRNLFFVCLRMKKENVEFKEERERPWFQLEGCGWIWVDLGVDTCGLLLHLKDYCYIIKSKERSCLVGALLPQQNQEVQTTGTL